MRPACHSSAHSANVRRIYGDPDQGALTTIQQATIAGWAPDQFAGWLRSQDEYQYTAEYRAKAVRLSEELGFITGNVPVLEVQPTPAANRNPGLPTDPRIKRKPSLPTGPLVVGGICR